MAKRIFLLSAIVIASILQFMPQKEVLTPIVHISEKNKIKSALHICNDPIYLNKFRSIKFFVSNGCLEKRLADPFEIKNLRVKSTIYKV